MTTVAWLFMGAAFLAISTAAFLSLRTILKNSR